jgi:hypothetical protein
MTVFNPLQTFEIRVQKQLILGKVADVVEEATKDGKNVAETLVIGTSFMSIFLKGVLGAMFTMVNSFQMMMVFCYMAVLMPANVILVMT